jgi:hypothetical protein
MKKTGIYIEVNNIKALLKELGFNWNGPACSFYELFTGCKNYIYGKTVEEEKTQAYFSSVGSPKFENDVMAQTSSYNYNKRPNSA